MGIILLWALNTFSAVVTMLLVIRWLVYGRCKYGPILKLAYYVDRGWGEPRFLLIQELAKNPHTPSDILAKIWHGEEDPHLRGLLSTNPNLPASLRVEVFIGNL